MTAPARFTPAGATVTLAAALTMVTGLNLLDSHDTPPREIHQLAEYLLERHLTSKELNQTLTWARLRVKALELWPQLANETGYGINRDNWRGWLSKREERYGATLPLPPR